jgi:hypothetical protein
MYYTLNTTIGTEIVVGDTTLVVGNVYDNKMKAPKDAQYILAFSKTDAGWRFDGSADLDFEAFTGAMAEQPDKCNRLAWKTARIDIQAKIRPSKDSKKAVKQAENAAAAAELKAKFDAGDITAEEWGKQAMILLAQLNS